MRSRYRENVNKSSANWTGSVYDASGTLTGGPYYTSSPIFTLYEGMNDVVGGVKGSEKPMNHIVSRTVIHNPSWRVDHSVNGFVRCTGARVVEADLGYTEPTLTSQEWEGLTTDFLNRLVDPMRSSLSLANFLLELKDLKRTFSFLKERVDKRGSAGFLSYNFGVSPFISDVKALAESFDKLLARLEYLLDNNGKPIKVSATFSKSIPASPLVLPSLLPQASGTLSWKATHTLSTSVTAHMWASVVYDTSSLAGVKGLRRAFYSYFGLDKPGEIVWNALPYSFVADWFTNFFSRIMSFSIQEEIPRRILRQGYWVRSNGTVMVSGGHVSDIQVSNNLFATRTWKTFRRSSGLPSVNVTWLNGLSDLSVKQLALGFALVHVRT